MQNPRRVVSKSQTLERGMELRLWSRRSRRGVVYQLSSQEGRCGPAPDDSHCARGRLCSQACAMTDQSVSSADGSFRIGRRSLRFQIVLILLALLAVSFVLVAAVTAVFLHRFLLDRLDQQLAAAGNRFAVALEHANDHDTDNATPFDAVTGQAAGTLGARIVAGRVTSADVVGRGDSTAVTDADRALIGTLPAGPLQHGPFPRSRRIPGIGQPRSRRRFASDRTAGEVRRRNRVAPARGRGGGGWRRTDRCRTGRRRQRAVVAATVDTRRVDGTAGIGAAAVNRSRAASWRRACAAEGYRSGPGRRRL